MCSAFIFHFQLSVFCDLLTSKNLLGLQLCSVACKKRLHVFQLKHADILATFFSLVVSSCLELFTLCRAWAVRMIVPPLLVVVCKNIFPPYHHHPLLLFASIGSKRAEQQAEKGHCAIGWVRVSHPMMSGQKINIYEKTCFSNEDRFQFCTNST